MHKENPKVNTSCQRKMGKRASSFKINNKSKSTLGSNTILKGLCIDTNKEIKTTKTPFYINGVNSGQKTDLADKKKQTISKELLNLRETIKDRYKLKERNFSDKHFYTQNKNSTENPSKTSFSILYQY